MTGCEFISKLLDIEQPMESNPIIYSTISLLLKGARKLSGCNIHTGQYEMNEFEETNFNEKTYRSLQFSGLINYLIFLEQIGSIFRPKNYRATTKSNGIHCALKHFSSLTDENKIHAIVSLRNSLTHKFGLATESNPRTKPARRFVLNLTRNSGVIQLPTTDWDGNFSDKASTTSTTVFIIDLICLIEEVYLKVIQENKDNNLDLIIAMDELKARYMITHPS